MTDHLMPIGEIARRSGMASSGLRYYERCGLLSAGTKINGRRHYPASVLHRLSVIKICQKLGFSLTEISELLNGNLARDGAWRQATLARRLQVERQIGQLTGLLGLIDCALRCDCHALVDCQHMGPGGDLAGGAVRADGQVAG